MKRAFVIVLLLAGSLQLAAGAQPRYNILLLVSDDLNNDLGCYGHPTVKSPQIDRLAQRGVKFERAYCQYPVCSGSRSSFMTGLRPNTTQVFANAPRSPDGKYENSIRFHFRNALPDTITLPQLFQRNGWWTARVGKVYHFGVPGEMGTNGLDDPPSWDAVINPIGRDKTEEETVYYLDGPPQSGKFFGGTLSWKQMDGLALQQTDGVGATEAIKLLEANRERPFFLAVGFYRPHKPFVATKEFFDRYPLHRISVPKIPADHIANGPAEAFKSLKALEAGMSERQRKEVIQAYYASISLMDAQVGRILDTVDRLGLAKTTIVVFTSDHGFHLGEHGLWQKGTLWENSARVPLIIAVPGMSNRGKSAAGVVELVDIYPTLAELAGLTLPHRLEGISLKPMLENVRASVKAAAFTQSRSGGVDNYSVRTERFRYIEWDGGNKGTQLFDHDNDPGEMKNLVADPKLAVELGSLQKLLRQYSAASPPGTRRN